jgi:hypothetical protein
MFYLVTVGTSRSPLLPPQQVTGLMRTATLAPAMRNRVTIWEGVNTLALIVSGTLIIHGSNLSRCAMVHMPLIFTGSLCSSHAWCNGAENGRRRSGSSHPGSNARTRHLGFTGSDSPGLGDAYLWRRPTTRSMYSYSWRKVLR